MTLVRLKGFKIYKDRHKIWRCYHRATGIAVDLKQFDLGTAQFFAECSRIAGLNKLSAEKKIGSLGSLIKSYRAHHDFLGLSPRTRYDYNRCFDYLKPIEDTVLSAFTSPLVVKIRDKAAQKMDRKWGNYVKTCLSLVFAWGVERGHLSVNPAFGIKGIKRPKDAPDVNPPWSDENRNIVLAEIPHAIDVEIHLMMFCGLDPGDVVKLPPTAIKDGKLNTRRQKTKEPIWVDLPDPVIKAIARAENDQGYAPKPDSISFCTNTRGKPWTKSGLDSAWQKYRSRLIRECKLPTDTSLTLKGLRHTVATILAEMGYDERTIADMLGQKTVEMARHYSRHANKTKKLTAVVQHLNAEIALRDQKVVYPFEKVSNREQNGTNIKKKSK